MEQEENFKNFFDKILPNLEVKEYFLNVLAISLSGKSLKQEFNICTGSGSNGKSVLFDLIGQTLGEYYNSGSPSLLTEKRGGANSASPAIAELRGKRLFGCSEPDQNSTIQIGVMKQLLVVINFGRIVQRFSRIHTTTFNLVCL